MWPALAEQQAIAMSAQSPRSRKVAFKRASGALSILVRVDFKHDPGHLAPLGPFFGSVQQTQIGHGVLPVIGRKLVLGWG
jgi:hypothetical protein